MYIYIFIYTYISLLQTYACRPIHGPTGKAAATTLQ